MIISQDVLDKKMHIKGEKKMRTVFEEELHKLLDDMTHLANAANESLHKAIQAYNDRDAALAHQLFADDLRINTQTIDIEQDAYRVIVLYQPVTDDLRKVFTILQASADLERMADHAVSIARAVIRRHEEMVGEDEIDAMIQKMANICGEMLTEAITAFREQDLDLARDIAARDNELDELLKEIYRVTTSRMETHSEIVNVGIDYINIGNNLERFGDYITNICERVVYLDTGSIVELN